MEPTNIYQRPAELLQHLIRFDTTNPPGNEAACIAYIDGLLKANRAGEVTLLIDTAGPSLRRHLWAWASIGMALISLRRYDQARTWQRDWRERNQEVQCVGIEHQRLAGRDGTLEQ